MNTFIEKHYKPLILSGVLLVAILFSISYFFQQTGLKSKASGEVVKLTFEPNTLNSASAGAHAPISTLMASPSVSMSIRGYNMNYTFDKSKVTVSSIVYKLGNASAGLGDTNETLKTVNSTGIIKIVGESQDANGIVMQANTKVPVVEITFALASPDPSVVALNSDSFGFSMINTDSTLTAVPVTGETLSINGGSVTPSPVVGNVTLNLKLKFQGIQKKPIDSLKAMDVKVTAVDESDSSEHVGTGTFTPDDKGIYSGSVPINLTINAGDGPSKAYKILVKGPQHVQKKVCDVTPTETVGGVYQCDKGTINLKPGANDFDFTGIYMLVGDLPQQDGIVNSYDTSLVLNSIGKTDLETLKIADLNRDGIVNFQDFSLVIAALSVRSDEK